MKFRLTDQLESILPEARLAKSKARGSFAELGVSVTKSAHLSANSSTKKITKKIEPEKTAEPDSVRVSISSGNTRKQLQDLNTGISFVNLAQDLGFEILGLLGLLEEMSLKAVAGSDPASDPGSDLGANLGANKELLPREFRKRAGEYDGKVLDRNRVAQDFLAWSKNQESGISQVRLAENFQQLLESSPSLLSDYKISSKLEAARTASFLAEQTSLQRKLGEAQRQYLEQASVAMENMFALSNPDKDRLSPRIFSLGAAAELSDKLATTIRESGLSSGLLGQAGKAHQESSKVFELLFSG